MSEALVTAHRAVRTVAPAAQREPQRRLRTASAAALLVALTILAYVPALRAGFVWDDDAYVTANQTLRTVDGLRRIWFEPGAVPQYYPLTFTSLWITYRLWGLNPLPYHLVNVLLHGLNAVLLWRVLRRLRLRGAWMAAAIFALHPMMVESVAWVTERKNVLSGMFALGAVLLYLRGEAVDAPGAHARSAMQRLAVGLLFVCALLSKTVTCTMPAILLLIEWWKRGAVRRNIWSSLAPLFVIGAGMAAVTVWMERYHVGAAGEEWLLSPLDHVLLAGRIVWFYPQTLLWPFRLTFIYPRWAIDSRVWWQFLFPAAALAVVATLYILRRRIGRGPLVALLCYTVTLVPALGFFNVYPMRFSFVADHFAYLAVAGLMALGSAAVARLIEPAGRRADAIAYAISIPLLLVLGVLTARQCGIYRDVRTLWTDALEKNPASWLAHNNLGAVLLEDGETDAAMRHVTQALQLKPDYAEAHYNLGNALRAQGRLAEAAREYAAAQQLQPTYAAAYNNLGTVLAAEGKSEDAIADYEQSLRWKPDYAEAHYNLGTILLQQRRFDEAEAHFSAALQLNADYAEAHNNLGYLYFERGQNAAAIAEYEQALRLRPDFPEAHTNMGMALAAEGNTAAAIAQYEAALQRHPDHVAAHFQLARAYARRADLTRAIAELQETLRLAPDHAEARQLLEVLQGVRTSTPE